MNTLLVDYDRLARSISRANLEILDPAVLEHPFVSASIQLATRAHGTQVRRGPDRLPYVTHLCDVALMTSLVTIDPEVLAAAILHDTVEDTSLSLAEIEYSLTKRTAELVFWLSDPPVALGRNRAIRKSDSRFRLSMSPPEALVIKQADLLSNLPGLRDEDPKFYKIYRREVLDTLPILERSPSTLFFELRRSLDSVTQREITQPLQNQTGV